MNYDVEEIEGRNWDTPQKSTCGQWEIRFEIAFNLVDGHFDATSELLSELIQTGMNFVQERYITQSEYMKSKSAANPPFPSLKVSIEQISDLEISVLVASDEHPLNFYFYPCYDFLFHILNIYIAPIVSIQGQKVAIWRNLMAWPSNRRFES